MVDLLSTLEAQIKALLHHVDQLKTANHQLKQTVATLVTDQKTLSTNHQAAVTHIKNMLSRLQSIERPL